MKNSIRITGDIIIGDPMEMVKSEEDWQLCEYGERMDKLGIKDFLCAEGEEDVPAVIDDNGNMLGSFCSDSGMVVVMRLDDLFTYNSDFYQHIDYPGNWTVINGFDGIVTAETAHGEFSLSGEGNISFHTSHEDWE